MSFQRRILRDYESGKMSGEQWGRLDESCSQRIAQAEAALENLRSRLESVERDYQGHQFDAALDRLNALTHAVREQLTAEDVPQLNEQLAQVFSEFRVTKPGNGKGVWIVPRLRREWLADPEATRVTPRVIDFSDDSTEHVRVQAEYPPAVLRPLDIPWSEGSDEVSGS